ncbi:MAG: hypothetical protein WBC72_08540, partial [Pseudolabrys sp.]
MNALRIDSVTRPLACDTAHDSAAATNMLGDSPDRRPDPGSSITTSTPARVPLFHIDDIVPARVTVL